MMEEESSYYSRVGMFRLDVLYVTPIDIDIYQLDDSHSYDTQNQYAVYIPSFRVP
jgi:hypothetical protein